MSGIDYYRILGVPPSATRRAIRDAYLGKVRSLHPDRVGPEGTALFQQITEAYENLSDTEKRRTYDRTCRAAIKQRDPETDELGFAAPAEPLVGEMYHTASSSAGRYTTQSSPDLVELQVTLTREESLLGVVLPLVVSTLEPCRWCGGQRSIVYRCRGCGGSGVMVGEQMLRIRIPSGVDDGSVMDVPLSDDRAGGVYLRLHIRIMGETGIW